jgi:predicted RNA-binding protein with PUA-like domain
MKRYFLAKTDPDTYSGEQFRADGRTVWDGVRSPQALRAIREMRPGDRVFIYHSGPAAAIVAVANVVSEPRPDPKDSRLTVVDLEYAGDLVPHVSLQDIKSSGEFPDFALVRQPRLSTMAAPQEFADWVLGRAKIQRRTR